MNENIEQTDVKHSKLTYASNASFQFPGTILMSAQAIFLFFYYEAVLGLSGWFIFLAMAIFTAWDAVNDPLIAFLADRNTRLTKRWGRRFPWIVIGMVPWCLSIYLIFSAPDIDARVNPLPIFLWLLMSLFIFDTFGTIVQVNIQALRPDKFRTEEERRKLTAFWTPFDMIAQALGTLIPPLFLGAGEGRGEFALMGALIAFIALIGGLLCLPGNREDKFVKDSYFSRETERMGFFKGIKEVFKQKSFVVFLISLITFDVATNLMIGNLIYLIFFVLRGDVMMLTLLFAVFLIGAFISVPFWLKLLKKTNNNKKAYIIAGIVLVCALIPMTFFVGFMDLLIIVFILGLAMGGMWAFPHTIIKSNVVDEYSVRTEKSQKAILLGAVAFVNRLASSIDELILALVHGLTGFKPGYSTYEGLEGTGANMELVAIGIRLLAGVIPMCILLIGVLIFWKFYPLTQEKVLENKAKLKELGL